MHLKFYINCYGKNCLTAYFTVHCSVMECVSVIYCVIAVQTQLYQHWVMLFESPDKKATDEL